MLMKKKFPFKRGLEKEEGKWKRIGRGRERGDREKKRVLPLEGHQVLS